MRAQSEGSSIRDHHRTTLAIAAVSALSLATITPYLATSGFQQSSVTASGQPAAEQNQPGLQTLNIGQHERGTMQQTIDNSSNASNGQTTVVINGQQIEVPPNGSYNKTTTDDSGRTNITVESSGSSSGEATSNTSSVRLNVHSESSSSSSD